MTTSNIKTSVTAGSTHEAFKAAKTAVRKDGYEVISASNPTETSSGKWEVEVMVMGEEKKTLKTILKPKKKTKLEVVPESDED
jgi:hypothetical protein